MIPSLSRSRCARLVSIVCSVVIGFWTFYYSASYNFQPQYSKISDFPIFYFSAKRMLNGASDLNNIQMKLTPDGIVEQHQPTPTIPQAHSPHNPKQRLGRNLNTPLAMMPMLGLGLLHIDLAFHIWSILSWFCYTIGCLILINQRDLFWHNKPGLKWAGFTTMMLFTPYMINLRMGQFGSYCFLVLVMVWALSRNHLRQTAISTTGFALLTSIKPFFAVFFLEPFTSSKRRLVLFIVCSLGFFFLPFALLPVHSFKHFCSDFLSTFKIGIASVLYLLPPNGSIISAVTKVAVFHQRSIYIDLGYIYLYAEIPLGICLYLLYRTIKQVKLSQKADFDYFVGVTLCLMLLISPLGWQYYFAFLWIPVLVTVQQSHRKATKLSSIFLTSSLFLLNINREFYNSPAFFHLTQPIYFVVNHFGCSIALVLLLLALMLTRTQNIMQAKEPNRQQHISYRALGLMAGIGSLPALYYSLQLLRNTIS